ncbi:Ribosomal protein L25/L23 [Desulfonatronospira thiodismutans ASO3-1]|uniref:Large ribosomal subunit protein uL23 n=1 Tax=Desulfonatronospira thiodismutans ASO3-1 TaxID=555779 RepID=D6SUN1_9BACT|nr:MULTISPECIES: 50S ribosomal protein L23 [Desulfonatronospira]EFI33011.1 Ribosomal protein L25/L23 [Desulfonatronospira thiodismutans ASO3-1]RQD74519.1 MAG: 50S ribosomal protein L23 [Desulfonatronospira sp. MSAO_Bac3]
MHSTQVLIRPMVSEKSNDLKEVQNKVVFAVHPGANKFQVKNAVESIFNVKVDKVNIIRRQPLQRKRFGRVSGKIPGYKKAFITLAAGDKIEFFEGV